MEVCGTHTMAIFRSGIKQLLASSINLISGPGCPVCVTSQSDIDRMLYLARYKDVVITTFGDMLKVPGTSGSLEKNVPSAQMSGLYTALLMPWLLPRRCRRKKLYSLPWDLKQRLLLSPRLSAMQQVKTQEISLCTAAIKQSLRQ